MANSTTLTPREYAEHHFQKEYESLVSKYGIEKLNSGFEFMAKFVKDYTAGASEDELWDKYYDGLENMPSDLRDFMIRLLQSYVREYVKGNPTDSSSATSEATILGMKPITFGLVIVLVVSAGIVARELLKKKS